MDRLAIKEEREKVLKELQRRCNENFIRNGFKSRLEIIWKDIFIFDKLEKEMNFRLNVPSMNEAQFVMGILNEELKSIGLQQINATIVDERKLQ